MGRPKSIADWWTRTCGGREVLRLALPLVASTISWTVMNFIDRMFLMWYSIPSMAAALPAGMLHFLMLCFPLGLVSYVNTFVAQYHGAGQSERIGQVVWQAVRVGGVCVPLFFLSIPLAPHVFQWAGHGDDVVGLEVLYFQVLALGGGATVVAAAQAAFFTGRGATLVVMMVDSLAAGLNVVLDYAWIFGYWGFPRLGIEGAAWATVVSQWFRVAFYLALMLRPAVQARYQLLAGRRLDWPLLRRLVRFGGPSGLQLLIEIGAITFFILLIGQLGEAALAATTLAVNVNSVAFVPMLGLGLAVSTIVGQQLGQNRPDLAARATWTASLFALTYTGTMAIGYITLPDLFLFGHAAGTDAETFASVRNTVVVLLRFVAVYCLFDAMAILFVSAIKGAGDTRFILLVSLIASPLPVLIGWLGIVWLHGGLYWCWAVITGWICTMGIVYLVRFQRGHWRTMRVIEPSLIEPDTTRIAESG